MSGCNSGVSARILEINPKALYIHCHAHRLNLVLVDTCKQLAEASDFFSLLECLYVFISSSVPHSVFISKQSSSRKVELKRLSDTRWSCRHSSIKAIKTSLSAVFITLEELSEGSDSHRAIGARGLLFQVKNFEFILSLVLFERIFSITSKLSDLLQAEKLNYAAAATCISATKRAITSLREEDEWFRIWEEAKSMGDEHGVPVSVARSRSRRSQSMPSRYNDSVVEETTGHGSIAVNDYRTHLYYRIIDIISEEMDNRFSDFNLTLLSAMQALLPGSQNFLDIHSLGPFLQHYCIDI